MKIYEENLGTDHINTSDSYNNISIVYKLVGNDEKAVKYYFKFMKIY